MRLDSTRLATLPPEVGRPRYDRSKLEPRIVHLGIGAFMRAHLAAATELALHQDADDPGWGIVGVSLRSPDPRDALQPQHGLYTLAVGDRQRRQLQVIGCVVGMLVAPEDPQAVLSAIADPRTRIISLTVTEKAYPREPVGGGLRVDDPDVVHDLANPQAARGVIGFIVHGLSQRMATGAGPVTLLSLDNLPANGQTLRRLVCEFAERVEPRLARWIASEITTPDSMVDRIVPRTTAADRRMVVEHLGCDDAWPVVCEAFFDWAVEDRFAAGRPAWERAGVRFVDSARPWESLKLRAVNGSHSAIACLGAVAGWQTVDVAIGQTRLRRYIEALLRDEVEPSLPPLPGLDLGAYRVGLLERFANPALAHRTQQIAMDGSQKIPQRLLGTVRDRLAVGAPIVQLGRALAGWLHYLRGHDESGNRYPIDDPLAVELADLLRRADGCTDARSRAGELTRFAPVFGELAGNPALVDAIAPALDSLRNRGVRDTLAAFA